MARGLGKGLGAMFGEAAMEPESTEVTSLPLIKVEPRLDQPRKSFRDEAMDELIASIKEHGVIQPLTVRPLGGGYYQIVAGERRWRAAREAGLDKVPVKVIEADDETAMVLALVENLQREDLNPMEEARGYEVLMKEYGFTQEEAALKVGKSRPVVANSLRLLKLPDEVCKLIEEGSLSISLSRTILELEGDDLRIAAARQIVEKNMTVREAEAYIKKLKKPAKEVEISTDVDYYAEVEKSLGSALGRRVKIIKGRKKGKIEIEYYNSEDFETLCQRLSVM